MNVKAFFVDALTSALDLGIATADDVLRHVTPDVLAAHLPRPLWARLLTACVGAPRVDAQLVIETIGVPNLCEHIPAPVIWACLAEVGDRSLGVEIAMGTPPPHPIITTAPLPITSPPPPEPVKEPPPPPAALGPSIPAPGAVEADERPRPRGAARFRPSSTGIGRLAASARRPQAQAPAPMHLEEDDRPSRPRRAGTELEVEVETAIAVEDEQLLDWPASEETQTSAGDDPLFGRKR